MRKFSIIALIISFFILACFILAFVTIPIQATRVYGPPSPALSLTQRMQYSFQLLWFDGLLTRPLNLSGVEQDFIVQPGESVDSIAERLWEDNLIQNAESFRAYLVYAGLDTSIQSGHYRLSPAMSEIDIAHKLQDATSAEVDFVVLPGWRMEEIAASLPTSGLLITTQDFISSASIPSRDYDFLSGATSLEGFLFPDSYVFPRTMTVNQLIDSLVRNFALHLTSDLKNGFQKQGLTVYQAVTLASIVEREAVHNEEKPLIASVYLNRLKINMKLDADPTIQYALGYDYTANTWWKNPLSLDDLKFNSSYNTYLKIGLPPAPIANPSLDALRAVAFPAETQYYFFRAKCDGSGYHFFAQTFDEQLANKCQ
jgi:UPF0755 protein